MTKSAGLSPDVSRPTSVTRVGEQMGISCGALTNGTSPPALSFVQRCREPAGRISRRSAVREPWRVTQWRHRSSLLPSATLLPAHFASRSESLPAIQRTEPAPDTRCNHENCAGSNARGEPTPGRNPRQNRASENGHASPHHDDDDGGGGKRLSSAMLNRWPMRDRASILNRGNASGRATTVRTMQN